MYIVTMSPERKLFVNNGVSKEVAVLVDEFAQTSRMLAVIKYPVGIDTLEKIGLKFWPEKKRPLVTGTTFNKRYYIKHEAEQYILQKSTEDEIKTAHEDCVKIFSKMIDWNDSLELRKHRLKHSALLGLRDLAISDIVQLCQRHKNENESYVIVNLLKGTNITVFDLPPESQEIFSWAYVQEQEIGNFLKIMDG